MQRVKELNRYQKTVLVLSAVLAVVFAVIYAAEAFRVGYVYQGSILVPQEENGCTVYSGRVDWEDACFTVTQDTVTFQRGESTYGPYTVREDPTAVPKEYQSAQMTGVEILDGDKVYFRGGVRRSAFDDSALDLYAENGTSEEIQILYVGSDGIVRDADGNIIDQYVPSAAVILELLAGPELTSRCSWPICFFGTVVVLLNIALILFADEAFRLGLIFRVSNVESVEPSEFEIAGRYIAWTILPILAVVVYIAGLRV